MFNLLPRMCSKILFYFVFQVILILTKYYHADSTKVLESSLWR